MVQLATEPDDELVTRAYRKPFEFREESEVLLSISVFLHIANRAVLRVVVSFVGQEK